MTRTARVCLLACLVGGCSSTTPAAPDAAIVVDSAPPAPDRGPRPDSRPAPDAAAGCTIAGKAVAALAKDPANACNQCRPDERRTAWSLASGCVGTAFYGGEPPGAVDGPVGTAKMAGPNAITLDKNDALYISDTGNDRIRRLKDGVLTTIAGGAGEGCVDGDALKTAKFLHTTGIALDGSGPDGAGKIYITDFGCHSIKLVANGMVTTFAGANDGPKGGGFVNGRGRAARFGSPLKALVEPTGKTLYVADTENFAVRAIDLATAVVTTYAGTGKRGLKDGPAATAEFDEVRGLGIDGAGAVYVPDANHRIRRIAGGTVTTLAGTTRGFADGPATTAKFSDPWDIAIDKKGRVFVTEIGNWTVRMIDKGVVTKIAGVTGSRGFADGPAAQAKFNTPFRIAVDSRGLVYIGDRDNNRVRVIRP